MNIQLSDRVQSIKPSPTLAITARANALKAAGKDIVGLGAGEPDFDTPHIAAHRRTHDMPLSARRLVCGCGNDMDRDLNAARNLANYAASAAVSACGVLSAGVAQAA